MSLDPPFTAEFANAGYLAEIPQDMQDKFKEQAFESATAAATWEDELVVAPFWSNTQVLWYRKSFVDQTDLPEFPKEPEGMLCFTQPDGKVHFTIHPKVLG